MYVVEYLHWRRSDDGWDTPLNAIDKLVGVLAGPNISKNRSQRERYELRYQQYQAFHSLTVLLRWNREFYEDWPLTSLDGGIC